MDFVAPITASECVDLAIHSCFTFCAPKSLIDEAFSRPTYLLSRIDNKFSKLISSNRNPRNDAAHLERSRRLLFHRWCKIVMALAFLSHNRCGIHMTAHITQDHLLKLSAEKEKTLSPQNPSCPDPTGNTTLGHAERLLAASLNGMEERTGCARALW